MVNLRSFLTYNTPVFAVCAAILGLYAMALCIGCGISLPV
jgi:hypothetical protein